MENNNEKTQKKVDNSNYRERFQFQLQVNDNIICQRYFKIPRFNSESLTSQELFETLGGYRGPKQEQMSYLGTKKGVVQLIKRDLESKSRIFTRSTQDCRTKMTGFAKDENGNPVNEVTYAEYEPKPYDETEFVKPWDVTFKFLFLVDDRVIYEEIWDGSQYPKYVRNSVDITNARSQYPMVQLMNMGKDDLVVEIIKRICEVCSNGDSETVKQYTKSTKYGVDNTFATASGISPETSKKYAYTAYARDYVNSWREYCNKKYGAIRS